MPERREIWYSDGTSGFYVLRVAKRVWPTSAGKARLPGTPGADRAAQHRPRTPRAEPARAAASRARAAAAVAVAWRWCVKGGKGSVTAVFDRRGRVALVKTTAPRHGNRRIHPGTSTRALRRAYSRLRSSAARWSGPTAAARACSGSAGARSATSR